eukprot:352434-Chlamydomonas_euryale.AAC.4
MFRWVDQMPMWRHEHVRCLRCPVALARISSISAYGEVIRVPLRVAVRRMLCTCVPCGRRITGSSRSSSPMLSSCELQYMACTLQPSVLKA